MPLFSVVIPSYNHAHFLRDAVESVLNQTLQDFEIIIVDDASVDNTRQVVDEFHDARIRYIVHPNNKGLSATRNTGIRASIGELIAFLDADDWYHPQKLELHADYLHKNPDVDVTYNARFELNHSAKTIRDIWRPPLKVGLADFVHGFPFAPSDMVLRRDELFNTGLLDESILLYGEDLYLYCKLARNGCNFSSVDRALNYRRYYSDKKYNNIDTIIKVNLRVLDDVFNDPRCSEEIIRLKSTSYAHFYLWYGIYALAQGETSLGQSSIQEATRLRPSLLQGNPCQLLDDLMEYSVVDDCKDHEQLLSKLIDQLPPDLKWVADNSGWTISRGYLIKAVRAVIWDRIQDAKAYFAKAMETGAKLDNLFLRRVSAQINSYEAEFGTDATQTVLNRLSPFLKKVGNGSDVNWLKGCYAINIGFRNYSMGNYANVPPAVFQAIIHDHSYLVNRGVLKILLGSLMKYAFQTKN
jgi:glycosyltransferase involved in cell wall biosynthesis